MLSKALKIGVVCATLTALWCSTPQAQAQRGGYRGGGGRSGGSVGVYVGPGGVGVEYGRGGYSSGGRYYGGYYGPYRSNYWYDSYPRYIEYNVVPTYTTESYYPAQPLTNARVRVRVPVADAEVFFNGSATQQRGMERVFDTPSLSAGSTYSYDIRARWRDPNGQMIDRTRTVHLQQGRETLVDFNQNDKERILQQPNRLEKQIQNPPIEESLPPQY